MAKSVLAQGLAAGVHRCASPSHMRGDGRIDRAGVTERPHVPGARETLVTVC